MKIEFLKNFNFKTTPFKKGDQTDLEERHALPLIANGVAKEIPAKGKKAEAQPNS